MENGRPLKIGMILDSHYPVDYRVTNEALTLKRAGHSVVLYCLDYTGKRPLQENIEGLEVHRIRVPKILHSIKALAYTIPLYQIYLKQSIYRFLDKQAVDVVHVHDMTIALAVDWANRRLRLPVVFDLHENRPEIMKFYGHVQTTLGKLLIYPTIWKKFERKYLLKFDKIIVVTNEAKDYYVNEFEVLPEKITVVPNTVKKTFYTNYITDHSILNKYKDRFVVLYIGDTGIRRGLLTLFGSISHLIDKIPSLLVVCVGDSKSDPILRKHIEEHNLQDFVELTGWQHHSLMPSYILASQICVSPLHVNIHHNTTYANKISQYLSLGKPIIVSNCTSQKNLVEKNKCGLVFKDRDVEDLASKILYLHKNPDTMKELGENGRRFIANDFHWEKVSHILEELYSDLARNLSNKKKINNLTG